MNSLERRIQAVEAKVSKTEKEDDVAYVGQWDRQLYVSTLAKLHEFAFGDEGECIIAASVIAKIEHAVANNVGLEFMEDLSDDELDLLVLVLTGLVDEGPS